MTERKFDLKVISEFDGSASGRVDGEGRVGLQDVPNETSRAHCPLKAHGWCARCLQAALKRKGEFQPAFATDGSLAYE